MNDVFEPQPYQEKITNSDFFFMIDNQIRNIVSLYEVGVLLPLAENILEQSNIKKHELINYPIEGYYYKTPSLKLYFKILRNLQMNKLLFDKIKDTSELRKLKYFAENSLFGQLKPYPIDGYKNAPIRRVYDIVTLTMEDKLLFDKESTRPWSIDAIMRGCSYHITERPNLVELGYMTGDVRCVCAGLETNSAYRMVAMVSCFSMALVEYIWDVSPKIEAAGKNLIHCYNQLLVGDSNGPIVCPNIFNHRLYKKTPELPKVANLGCVTGTAENYFWVYGVDDKVTDIYTTKFLTAQTYTEHI